MNFSYRPILSSCYYDRMGSLHKLRPLILLLIFFVGILVSSNFKVRKPAIKDKSNTEGKRKIVLIATYTRSGSSFLGEIFSRNRNAFYLFEPLFPFGHHCDDFNDERVQFLKNISKCDFTHTPEIYQKLLNVYHYSDSIFRCVSSNICFSHLHTQAIASQYKSVCKTENLDVRNASLEQLMDASRHQRTKNFPLNNSTRFSLNKEKSCWPPYNTTLESAICLTSQITAFKLLRVCNMAQVQQVYHDLKQDGEDVYVIHLIRDMRATIASRILAGLARRENIPEQSKSVCDSYRDKINFFRPPSKELLNDSKLLEIRNEDLTMNAIEVAERVYRFIGETLDPHVQQWIWENNVATGEQVKNYRQKLMLAQSEKEKRKWKQKLKEFNDQFRSAYGTARDPRQVIYKWRNVLSFEETKLIQSRCADVLEHYKYRIIQNEPDLRNKSIQTW